MAMHLHEAYEEGRNAEYGSENPYDFFNEYEANYAWCIGNQKGRK